MLVAMMRANPDAFVQGNVNRLKMLKCQTYGRAGFDLRRKWALLAY